MDPAGVFLYWFEYFKKLTDVWQICWNIWKQNYQSPCRKLNQKRQLLTSRLKGYTKMKCNHPVLLLSVVNNSHGCFDENAGRWLSHCLDVSSWQAPSRRSHANSGDNSVPDNRIMSITGKIEILQ
jgi:hypothetical protein